STPSPDPSTTARLRRFSASRDCCIAWLPDRARRHRKKEAAPAISMPARTPHSSGSPSNPCAGSMRPFLTRPSSLLTRIASRVPVHRVLHELRGGAQRQLALDTLAVRLHRLH